MIRTFLGGSFDPPHLGHLELLRHAHESLSQLGLAFELSVIPTQGSPFKNTQTSYEDRCQMLSLAIESVSLPVAICRLEANMSPPVYSVDVFGELRARHPDDRLILLVGSDSLSQMPQWHQSSELHALLSLWVIERNEIGMPRASAGQMWGSVLNLEALRSTAQKLKFDLVDQLHMLSLSGAVFFDAFSPPAISSSLVRSQVKNTTSTVNLVPEAVARYIEQNSVYL